MRTLDALGRPLEIGWVSGSALTTAVKCAASAVLWRVLGVGVAATRIGSALHDHLRHRNLYGIASAIEMLPELAERYDLRGEEADLFYARARAFEWNPPRGSVAELPLCLFEDGRVEVVEGGRGQYDKLGPDALIPAQIDLFWAEPDPLFKDRDGRLRCPPSSVLWVIDLKTGKEQYVEDAERNAQALASALLAAKFTGATKVVPGLVFLRKGRGIWDVPTDANGGVTYLEAEGLARVEEILRQAVYDVRRARDAHRRGLPLIYRQGPHCNMCGARHACPAHLALIKSWTNDPAPLEPGALEPEQLRQLAELAPSFRAFAKSVNDALQAHVVATGEPIAMSDGRLYGPHARPRTHYDATKAIAALATEIGAEAAGVASPREITEAAMKRAIERDHEAKGLRGRVSSAWRRVFGRIARAGGLIKTTPVQWGFYKPNAKPEELPQRTAALAALHGIDVEEGDAEYDD